MKKLSRGFGLVEMMVALTLGLIVVAGVTQIFLAARNTYTSQTAAAGMQEDARFVLSKMLQEIRMIGMFGCVGTVADSSSNSTFTAAYNTPITWDNANKVLTLVTADVGNNGATPAWTIISDCLVQSTAYTGARAPAAGQIALPVRQLVYSFANNQIFIGPTAGRQPLISNVQAFSVSFGMASTVLDSTASSYTVTPANPTLIRSIRLTLTLSDPTARVSNRTFSVVAAVRNRLR
ncbi:PilW family protein [Pseudomonas gingeri]|uniref:PilW family protein n=1 Tax=Pseudomonas gingeri TaxID=117681 RepID=UPI0015A16C7D|nr:prepilin-type N-terminal cleavage/methylation domain-containing protein [Pseudomonas gingeri]NWD09283.1 prepilin-type N-terminal cleavage/methylation domain-containing protein [Pseudomonas gingeri]NWE32060.1 prepilin-type N-terminal cleavage/methylation domain-containing protein [Pseudomonas gingeri]NWE58722.1 prepilin-type N-terminal cleavage/methylation domain-containing protein [Pseudomonas gingeri]NWF01265.1 prepilin-type N-terminal cleavage/methylation domain-containing protein [Pseudom